MQLSWSVETKRLLAGGLVLLGLLAVYFFNVIIGPLGVTFTIAYLLNPLVDRLMRRTRCSRTLATVIIYLGLLMAIIVLPFLLTPLIIQQMQGIRLDVRAVIDTATTFLEQHQQVEILGYAINLMGLEEQLSGNIQELISPFVMRTASLVASSASAILWIGFVFFGSFYMVRDTDKIDRYVHSLVPPRYKDEIESLFQETIEVWNEYFRGKIILGGVVGIITFIMLEAVGVRSSLLFGLLAGILEFIPTIGPVAASLPAILLALFQGSTRLPISNIGFAILVIALYLFLHQIVKGNVLVPHIIGHSVNLNPLVVLVGVMLGASVAGILGLFFAAPVIATLRIWVGYVYGKLLDHEAEPPAAETD